MTDAPHYSDQQKLQAQLALDQSAFNGICCLAIVLKKRGLLNQPELAVIHEMMSKPLALPENADNGLVQDAQRGIDDLFSDLFDNR